MRILGFSEHWQKLDNDLLFTTFRFARKDADRGRDWAVEETVQIFYKPRSPKREFLGIARIIRKQPKNLSKLFSYFGNYQANTPDVIRPDEAEQDGFINKHHGGGDTEGMRDYFHKTYGWAKCDNEPIYKLTLYWIKKANKVEVKTP
jgi:hypothetical protein